jgi:hypothetical protein
MGGFTPVELKTKYQKLLEQLNKENIIILLWLWHFTIM